ncbi:MULTISPECIES: peptidase domain-containing ABC transporter [unclassified Carboxylicivirga]|uniref:peptidase domain-containing ABC transporter n=1 Tax=Carboxylicivirga TaxID=1628153 RepID=UPI003D33AAD6
MTLNVQQFDATDCGAACLASVARYYKLYLPLWTIRRKAGTNRGGTSAYGLIRAAEQLGFDAKGIVIEAHELNDLPTPAIAHLKMPGGTHHFVVIYRVGKKMIKIMDPATGRMERLTQQAFLERWTGVAVLLIPAAQFQKGDKTVSNIGRFARLIGPHRSVFVQAGFGALAFSLLGLSTAFYIQKLTDFVLVGHNHNLLHLMGVIMILVFITQLLIGILQSWFVLRVSQNIDTSLISGYFRHLIRLPQKFYDSMRIGELIARINDAVKIRNFINQVAVEAVVDALIVLVAFVVMFFFSWRLALLAYSVVPLYVLLFFITNAFNRRLERARMEETAELEIQLVESLRSVKTIKQMGAEGHFADAVDHRLMRLLHKVYQSGKMDIFSVSGMQLINRCITLAILWLGAGLVIQTELTAGELMSFFAITAFFTGPVARLTAINKSVHGALIAMDRLFELLELEAERGSEDGLPFTHEDVGEIQFSGVDFSYSLEQTLFCNFYATIKPGVVTVLLGDSGSGKSTLAALIQGLYPLDGGRITIGDYDVSQLCLGDLRRVVGIVPQQIELFAGNVIDNIALGDGQPDVRRINDIIKALRLSECIEHLPEGLYTWLGENAVQLSGGQRQRLAIARLLYLNPQVYIFDEATSYLDDRSEAVVKKVIEQLKADGKTIIMVAHRMSVMDLADEVMVFDRGKILQAGKVEVLKTDRQGRFYEMWKHHHGGMTLSGK